MSLRRIAMAGGLGLLSLGPSSVSSAPPAQPDIYDFLIMNVCVGAAGRPVDGNPLTCRNQRNYEPGDTLSYVHADFPTSPSATGCKATGISRRFAIPLRTAGSDERGRSYLLIAAWTDYPPASDPCGFGSFDNRDTATLLAVGQQSASLVGAFHHGGWFLTVGEGYRRPERAGVSRFMGTWSFPRSVPAVGDVGWGIFPRRTMRFGARTKLAAFPKSDPSFRLTQTVQYWKRLTFEYGLRQHPTATLDTLLHIPFTKVNGSSDGPGESRGSEHFYLTKELGYVTRWESWAREDANKDVLALARRAYTSPACTKPATIEGEPSPGIRIGPVVEDQKGGFYYQVISTKNAGLWTKHRWYLTGCHDFTNVIETEPFNPSRAINEDTFGSEFMKHFIASRS